MNGICVFFDVHRGFGRIRPLIGKPESAPEVYFHKSAILAGKDGRPQGIPEGCEVAFDLVRGEQGPQAFNVRAVLLKDTALRKLAVAISSEVPNHG